MAKMTNLQIEHARNRLRQITREVLGAKPTPPTRPDGKDLIKALATEKGIEFPSLVVESMCVIARETLALNTYYSRDKFMDALAEKIFALKNEAITLEYQEEKATYDARRTKFNAQATAVEDAIILGDGSEALAKLNELAEFKFDGA